MKLLQFLAIENLSRTHFKQSKCHIYIYKALIAPVPIFFPFWSGFLLTLLSFIKGSSIQKQFHIYKIILPGSMQ